MKIQIPEKVNIIIQTLIDNGYEAYAVGGCVRDALLCRVPDDWDITTSAKPAEVKELFRRTVDTGLKHGTVTVLMGNDGFEVTTYRIDGEYEDSRHPKEVVFTANLEEDLKRRDFTINAMAYNEECSIVDCFDGIGDLKQRIIRCVGNPEERFQEDALRILRAVRFSAQLGFSIEGDTKEAIKRMASSLARISAERIQTELLKILVSPNPDFLYIAYEVGITRVILPEFDLMMTTPQRNPHHQYNVGEHTIQSVTHIEADKVLRLTMLLHDIGKPATHARDEEGIDHFNGHNIEGKQIAVRIMRRLKLDNDTINKVKRLVKWHDYRPEANPRAVRRAVNKVGEDIFMQLLLVQRADTLAQSAYLREEKLERIQRVKELYKKMKEEQQCMSLKDLAVTGNDLIDAGMRPGREIGDVLKWLLELVLDEPERNDKEYLLNAAKKRQNTL